MNRSSCWIVGLIAVGGVLCFFPLFRILPLKQAQQEKAAATFDAAKFAETFWSEKLVKSFDRAVLVEELVPAIRADAAAARKRYGRTLGLSESYTYYVAGNGWVVSTNGGEVALALDEKSKQAEIVLPTGLLFGNAVRDGTGLLNVNDYPNSQDFNAIGEALNRIVESRVLPGLKEQATNGAQIYFIGCAEVADESSDLRPLRVVPFYTEAR